MGEIKLVDEIKYKITDNENDKKVFKTSLDPVFRFLILHIVIFRKSFKCRWEFSFLHYRKIKICKNKNLKTGARDVKKKIVAPRRASRTRLTILKIEHTGRF